MKEKKSKLKENITLFKKAWKIPKYKALIKLGIYLIFIFSLIFMIRFCGNSSIDDTSNNQIQELNSTQKLEIMSNYESPINIIPFTLRVGVEKGIPKAVYVDKDELIKTLTYYEKGFSDAIPKWISIEERLPKAEENVLVTIKDDSAKNSNR